MTIPWRVQRVYRVGVSPMLQTSVAFQKSRCSLTCRQPVRVYVALSHTSISRYIIAGKHIYASMYIAGTVV